MQISATVSKYLSRRFRTARLEVGDRQYDIERGSSGHRNRQSWRLQSTNVAGGDRMRRYTAGRSAARSRVRTHSESRPSVRRSAPKSLTRAAARQRASQLMAPGPALTLTRPSSCLRCSSSDCAYHPQVAAARQPAGTTPHRQISWKHYAVSTPSSI